MFKIVNARKYEEMEWYNKRIQQELTELKEILQMAYPGNNSINDFIAISDARRIVEKALDLKTNYLMVRMSKSFMIPNEIIECVPNYFESKEYEIRGPFREELVSQIIEVRTRDKNKIDIFVEALEKFSYPISRNGGTVFIDF